MFCISILHTFYIKVLRTLITLNRKLYLPNDGVDPKPGRQGIALRLPESTKLKERVDRACLAEARPCSFSVDHSIIGI